MPILPEALVRAQAAGVSRMVCCGTGEADWARVAHLAEEYDALLPQFGLHPWYVASRSPRWMDRLQEYLTAPGAGVGEIGLDHALAEYDAVAQEEVFMAQVQLACRLQRPVSIHCRRAWGRMMALLEESGPFASGFAIHSFSGPVELIPRLTALGGYLSFSGSITRPHNKKARRALLAVPRERLLFETDAPDIPPMIDGEVSGQPNEPAHIRYVINVASELLGLTVPHVAELNWNNACALFQRSPESPISGGKNGNTYA